MDEDPAPLTYADRATSLLESVHDGGEDRTDIPTLLLAIGYSLLAVVWELRQLNKQQH